MTADWTSHLTIDLEALAANYAGLKRKASTAEVAPVVKADAYGLGASLVAVRLFDEGARRFFVARICEGETLRRRLGPDRPARIYVLDGCPRGAKRRLQAAQLTPVLNSVEQIEDWASQPQARGAALHVDTGLNRLGLTAHEARQGLERGLFATCSVEMILSHLACATTPDHAMNSVQLDRFGAICSLWPRALKSLANTAGIYLGDAYHYDVVRPGVGLYGGGPFETPHPDHRPVVTFCAPILQIRRIEAGETVGYGAVWRADRPTTLAIIAAGYADGVLRALGGGGYGWLDGHARPFVGRISMDLIALDVTDSAAARPGAMIELLGDHVLLNDVARLGQTAPYEILTRVGRRARRIIVSRP